MDDKWSPPPAACGNHGDHHPEWKKSTDEHPTPLGGAIGLALIIGVIIGFWYALYQLYQALF